MSQKNLNKKASLKHSILCNINGLTSFMHAIENPDLLEQLEAALDLIFKMKGRLIITGMGKSGLIGRKLAATFSSTGTPAYFVHPGEASHGDLGMIQQTDVLLMLSWSGETKEMYDILTYAARFKVPTIALTGAKNGTLARRSTIALVSPVVEESCPHNLAPTTSTLVQMAIGDALAITLLKMKGFTEESFRNFHPGGKLGAILTPIKDIMFTDDELPLLTSNSPVIKVIAELSHKSKGVVGLTDSAGVLRGVITDGDIRRYLESKSDGSMKDAMWETKATELMTSGSITLNCERMSARALNILQEHKISAAFIVNSENKPIGLITILQLLQAGVA